MHIGLPQAILTGLLFIGLGVNMAKHKQPKDDTYNGWTSLLAIIIELTLLYWGGFFN